jgi:transcription elongation factor GreA
LIIDDYGGDVKITEYTPEYFANLEEALRDAITEHQKAQLRIGTVTEGDTNVWHDNFGFEEANREEQRCRQLVARLSRLVAEAKVVARAPCPHSVVELGSHVTIRTTGREATYFMGGGALNFKDTTSEGVAYLSTEAPIGAALLGHSAGDVVSYKLPGGRLQEAEIVQVW